MSLIWLTIKSNTLPLAKLEFLILTFIRVHRRGNTSIELKNYISNYYYYFFELFGVYRCRKHVVAIIIIS